MTQVQNITESPTSKKGSHLSYKEMCKIEAWHKDGHSKTRIGYEIPFTRYFYKYEELRPFKDIMAEIEELEQEIQEEIEKVIQ